MHRVVIVDDEPPARRKMAMLLSEHPEFGLAGQAGSAEAAIATVSELMPDLLLLDVQLGDSTGFAVLERLPKAIQPLTIFVTAFGDYAVQAFEVRAVDYLMKPVVRSRFAEALQRVREALHTPANSRYLKRFLIRADEISYFVEASQVDWLESARNYVVLHTGATTHIVRATLEGLSSQLDPDCFSRVSRTAVVNVKSVKGVGTAEVLLRDGTSVRTGKQYLDSALARWKG